jgi:hypothetical protein
MSIEKEIIELLKSLGAVSVGFANLETLAGGPPSADLRYIMPEASAVGEAGVGARRAPDRGALGAALVAQQGSTKC